MITLLLIIFAGAINACMDTLKNHFSVSVFKNLNPSFWNHALVKPNQVNAHLVFKSIKLMLLLLSVIFYQTISHNVPIDVAVCGISWMIINEVVSDYLYKS